MKSTRILMLVLTTLTTDLAFAQTWTQTSAPSAYWSSIASSADGSRLIATAVNWMYAISTNSGIDWITNTEPQIGTTYGSWAAIAMSADGTEYVAANANAVWVSTNSGTTWLSNSIPGASMIASLALSADGSKIVAGDDGFLSTPQSIYTSTNLGATWLQTSAPTNIWRGVASSADGSKLVAVATSVHFTNNGNFIYRSTNSGASWILTYAPTNVPWRSVASSADGSKLVAASDAANATLPGYIPGSVYTSTDFGTTWIQTSAPSNVWISVASSADGNKLVAMTAAQSIYTSIDSGVTWTSNDVPTQSGWQAVVSSADGNKLVAASVFPGNIFTFQITPTPQLNIAPANGDFNLAWIIPSADFALQQNLDLTTTNWVTLTNAFTLNLTNLQNQVTLSPSNGNSFYRLMAPGP